ncbi:hypothetical protein J6590_042067 [Homalodisca vitripennis]|nr:hypothetical protein J6590_042067 [Homalodisca vitripennis]
MNNKSRIIYERLVTEHHGNNLCPVLCGRTTVAQARLRFGIISKAEHRDAAVALQAADRCVIIGHSIPGESSCKSTRHVD